MSPVSLSVVDNPARQRFEARTPEGQVAGFVQYRSRSAVLLIVHTEVDPAFKGQGVGSTVVRGALDLMRAEGQQAVVECPFVRRFLDRHPGEYEDVVAAQEPR